MSLRWPLRRGEVVTLHDIEKGIDIEIKIVAQVVEVPGRYVAEWISGEYDGARVIMDLYRKDEDGRETVD